MSEKLDKLRADLARARERRIQLNNRIELLERRIAEAERWRWPRWCGWQT